MTSGYTRPRGPCPRCHYIGNRHLCGCMAKLRRALDDGDLDLARRLLAEITTSANREDEALMVVTG